MNKKTMVIRVNNADIKRGAYGEGGIVYIGRNAMYLAYRSRDDSWGNPHRMQGYSDAERQRVIAAYIDHLFSRPDLLKRIPDLRGRQLACYCAPKACHGDVLAELANNEGFVQQMLQSTPEHLARGASIWREWYRIKYGR